MPSPANDPRLSDLDDTGAPTERGDTNVPGGAIPAAPAFGPPAEPGEAGTLGHFRIVKELGRGGMGAVYAAVDTRLNRKLALKVMLPKFAADPAAKERFLREARAAGQVTHDNVVTVYDADERNGVPYIAMQFLEGYPLDEYLKKKGNPSLPQVLRIARETAAGLAAAHRIGLVHRDIKPGNLWLEVPNGRVKVLDFGLAKPLDSEVELTKSGAVVGTPAYMSPEQARGQKIDARSDLFSLGAVLYRLTTGRLPFEGPNTMAVLMALGTEDPVPVRELNPAVPEPLAALIHQLLAKKPGDRPQTASAVVQRVRDIAEGRIPAALAAEPVVEAMPASAMPVTVVPDANPFAELDLTEAEPAPRKPPAVKAEKRRRPWLWVGGGVAAVLLVAVGVLIATRKKGGGEPKGEPPAGPVASTDKVGKSTTAKPINLLAMVDAQRDKVAGRWQMIDGKLVAGGPTPVTPHNEKLQIPYVPPAEYDMTLVVERDPAIPNDRFHAFLVTLAAPHQFQVVLDWATDGRLIHMLGSVDGKVEGNETTVAGAEFAGGRAVRVDIRVRRDEVGVRLDGKDTIRFQGDLGRLSYDSQWWAMPDPRCVGLGCQNAEYRIREWTLTPVGDDKAADNSPDRRVAEWVLKAGGSVQVFVDGESRDIKSAALFPKRPFVLTLVSLFQTGAGDADLARFGDLRGLRSLVIMTPGITDAGLVHLKDCGGLRYISLHGTSTSSAGLQHLRGLKLLEHVDLRNGRPPSGADLAQFHIAVPQCWVEYDGGNVLGRDTDRVAADWVLSVGGAVRVHGRDGTLKSKDDLPREPFALTGADLAGRPVRDADLDHLRDSVALADLDLSGTGITDAGLDRLQPLLGLTALHLRKTAVTAKGLGDFHWAVPDCKVEHDGGVVEPGDPNRRAAEWALDLGGEVQVNNSDVAVKRAADLPHGRFVVTFLFFLGRQT